MSEAIFFLCVCVGGGGGGEGGGGGQENIVILSSVELAQWLVNAKNCQVIEKLAD